MDENIYFEQCMDFLARMIEKYGDKVDLPDTAKSLRCGDVEELSTAA